MELFSGYSSIWSFTYLTSANDVTHFQEEPFNSLSYLLLGDETILRYFAINSEGQVTVRGDLANAPGEEIQYVVGTYN